MVSAGRMNTRVQIRPVVETNSGGSLELTYPSTAARGKRWAEKRGLSMVEQYRAQQLDASAEYMFTFQWDSVTRAISVKDRLLVGATSATHTWFDIAGVQDPDGRNRMLLVSAKARHED
jgi:head-tail adaptor